MKNFIWFDYRQIPLDRILGTVFIAAAAIFVILYLTGFLRRLLMTHRQRLHLSYETVLFGVRFLRVVLWVGTGFLLLSLWGVAVSGLWTALVSVATIVGVGFLAVWTMISNITANLFLTIWHPFYLGATVELLPEHLKGRVIDRNMMYTVLRQEDGSALYVPNNTFFQKYFSVHGEEETHLFEAYERQMKTSGQRQDSSKMPV